MWLQVGVPERAPPFPYCGVADAPPVLGLLESPRLYVESPGPGTCGCDLVRKRLFADNRVKARSQEGELLYVIVPIEETGVGTDGGAHSESTLSP